MSDETHDGRHLSFSNLTMLWGGGSPVLIPVQGTPECRIRLDPALTEITLITPYATPEPEVAPLRNVSFTTSTTGTNVFAEISVTTTGNLYGTYSFLTAIADELQQNQASLAAAVASAIAEHQELLSRRGTLTTEQEIGLFGELLLVGHLIGVLGPAAATASWKGPSSGEHDFVLPGNDLEVKTTSTERRAHMIGSLTQLEPRPGAPLIVVSVQLTRTSRDAGKTLAGLVAEVRSLAGGYAMQVDQCLDAAHWTTQESELYTTYWSLRTRPRAYEVDATFPRLTTAGISAIVKDSDAISEIRYRIDLTNMKPATYPLLAGFASDREDDK